MVYQEKLPSTVTRKELEVLNIPVVDNEGKEIVRPDVIQAVVQLASLGQLARIRKSLEGAEFEGISDERVLSASGTPKVVDLIQSYPYRPWITAYFISDGVDPVRIKINRDGRFFTLYENETRTVDRAKAKQRIELIYYECDVGETATIRVTGEY